jgi:hypothetical protein
VARVITVVSEEHIASIIRAERINELRTLNAVPSSPIIAIMMMEALSSSETSLLIIATRRHIPEDGILHDHRRENLRSYILMGKSIDYITASSFRPYPIYGSPIIPPFSGSSQSEMQIPKRDQRHTRSFVPKTVLQHSPASAPHITVTIRCDVRCDCFHKRTVHRQMSIRTGSSSINTKLQRTH